jgi:mannosyl-oligosaccharide alpha-1,2-mannosidase
MPSTFASQAHKASTRVVLAELGSLAVEFTRLAQITKEPKYYDAIARITNGLEEWQNRTRLPGMWPTYVDASGCERVMYKSPSLNIQTNGGSTLTRLDWKGNPVEEMPGPGVPPISSSNGKGPSAPLGPKAKAPGNGGDWTGRIKGWDENHPETSSEEDKTKMEPIEKPDPLIMKAGSKVKRQFNENTLKEPSVQSIPQANIPPVHMDPPELPAEPECLAHGLGSQSQWGTDEFTLGSLSDSTYEYLPKVCRTRLIEIADVNANNVPSNTSSSEASWSNTVKCTRRQQMWRRISYSSAP